MSEPGAEKELEKLRRLPDNLSCCNCSTISKHGHGAVVMSANGAPLGIFVCHTCKSASQSFSHLCKSVSMSYWSKAEVAKIKNGGNARIRTLYMANLPPSQRLSPGVALPVAKNFVKACYIDKCWYDASAKIPEPVNNTNSVANKTTLPSKIKNNPINGSAPPLAKPRPAAIISPPPSIPKPQLHGHSMSDSALYLHSPPVPEKAKSCDAVSDLLSFDDVNETNAISTTNNNNTAPPAAVSPDTSNFFDAFAPLSTNSTTNLPPTIHTRLQSAPVSQQYQPQQSAFSFIAQQHQQPMPLSAVQQQYSVQSMAPPHQQQHFASYQRQAAFNTAPPAFSMPQKSYQQQQQQPYNSYALPHATNTAPAPTSAMMCNNNSGAAISQMWSGF
mmetsp:Transcript_4411/g.6261  ORF Transcript_4411/g.6261 Transcript_4411/m.6261 type:complete len:387 (+) Transcript_4411:71-1231(+)